MQAGVGTQLILRGEKNVPFSTPTNEKASWYHIRFVWSVSVASDCVDKYLLQLSPGSQLLEIDAQFVVV